MFLLAWILSSTISLSILALTKIVKSLSILFTHETENHEFEANDENEAIHKEKGLWIDSTFHPRMDRLDSYGTPSLGMDWKARQ